MITTPEQDSDPAKPFSAIMDHARTIRNGEELDYRKTEGFFREQFSLKGDFSLKQFPAGYSNLTYLVKIGASEFVLRTCPHGTKAKSSHDMKREFAILKTLRGVFPYCPESLYFTEDPAVLGKPFFVMERLRGVILRRTIPAESGISAKVFQRICEEYIDILAELHKIDYTTLNWTVPLRPEGYAERQITGWIGRYERARTPNVPKMTKVMNWLRDNLPPTSPGPSVLHNDYKLDNLVLDPTRNFKIIGVLDWEMATVGDPLMDLGSSLGYWIEGNDPWYLRFLRTLPTTERGALRRQDLLKRYARSTGSDTDHFNFYYCFGLFRLAVIAQQIYRRYYLKQTKDKRFGKLFYAIYGLNWGCERVIKRDWKR